MRLIAICSLNDPGVTVDPEISHSLRLARNFSEGLLPLCYFSRFHQKCKNEIIMCHEEDNHY